MRLETLHESDTRRDFLQKTVGTAAGLATNPLQTIGKLAAGAAIPVAKSVWDSISDAELLETPEDKWVGKIPRARLNRIVRQNPEHGRHEFDNKLMKVAAYGLASMSPGYGNEALNTAVLIRKAWGVSGEEIAERVARMARYSDGYYNTADIIAVARDKLRVTAQQIKRAIQKLKNPKERQAASKAAREAGIDMADVENLSPYMTRSTAAACTSPLNGG